ncbi:hypothetical protein PRIEUP_LOCUS610, partial [Pristimantis euphronides]
MNTLQSNMLNPKHYLKDGMNERIFLQTYFSTSGETPFGKDTLISIMEKLHEALGAGNFKGDLAYDFSFGSIMHHLYAINNHYKKITIMKLHESCILELNKWLAVCSGAFDWTQAHNCAKELEGTSCQEDLNMEDKLKNSITGIMKFDLMANPTGLEVLKQASCMITAWLLDVISKDKSDYVKNFRCMTEVLRPGGLLIIIGCLDTSYFKVGEKTYHVCTYNESFLRQHLANEGYKISTCKVLDRTTQSDLTDYEQFIIVTAIKK